MRYIQKGSEPSSLTAYRKNKNAYYDGYPYKDLDFTNCDFTEAINNSIKDLKDLDSWEIDYIGTSVI